MKTRYLTIAIMALLMGLMSCKRDNPNDNSGNTNPDPTEVKVDAKDLVVPAKFNFETEKELTLRVGVSNPSFPGERFVIKVYNEVPPTGSLITTGITDAVTHEYTTTIRVPAYEEYIYIEKIDPDGSSRYEKVKANKFATALFTGNPNDGKYTMKKSGSGMTCSSGCSSTSNNLSGSSTINNNHTRCFTGTLSGATILVKSGGTAKICGSGTISSLTVQGTGKVYFLEGSSVTISSFSGTSSDNLIKSWGDSIVFSGSVSLSGDLYNYGGLYVGGALSGGSSSLIKNYDVFSVAGSMTTSNDVYNYHHFSIGGSFDMYSGSDVSNCCYMSIAGDMSVGDDLWSSGYIKVGGTYTQNSSTEAEFDDGAVLAANNIVLNGDVNGTGTSRSKIKVTASTTINSNGDVDGKIDLCDSNGIETNNGGINSPAAASCSGYICASTCFPDGFGQPAIQDADSDGVADAQDEYPNDAARAFNSYYPSATTTATLAFEDLWPATGDYDYNDLVLGFNIHKVLNADNKVVDYKVKMKVRAVGASFDNGFGFQLDELAPSDIQTITGQIFSHSYVSLNANKTEAGQSKAVVICYDSPESSMQRATGSMFNTIQANPVGTSDTIRINVTMASPVLDSKLGIEDFNPFIMTNRRRGYEVHLGNFRPTDLASTNLFGTLQDRTNVGNSVFYKTGNGMPWAILIPVDFAYPIERSAVTSAYNFFDDWAVSGGSSNNDWYTDNPGNRNTSDIFSQN